MLPIIYATHICGLPQFVLFLRIPIYYDRHRNNFKAVKWIYYKPNIGGVRSDGESGRIPDINFEAADQLRDTYPVGSKLFTKRINRMKNFPPYRVGRVTLNPGRVLNTGDWIAVNTFLQKQDDIKKRLCIGCSAGRIYDNNGKEYKISRSNTLKEIELLVEEIRKINNSAAI